MEKMIANYIEKVKELQAYGEKILNSTTEEDWDNFNELFEIENMTEHCKICDSILEGKVD